MNSSIKDLYELEKKKKQHITHSKSFDDLTIIQKVSKKKNKLSKSLDALIDVNDISIEYLDYLIETDLDKNYFID